VWLGHRFESCTAHFVGRLSLQDNLTLKRNRKMVLCEIMFGKRSGYGYEYRPISNGRFAFRPLIGEEIGAGKIVRIVHLTDVDTDLEPVLRLYVNQPD